MSDVSERARGLLAAAIVCDMTMPWTSGAPTRAVRDALPPRLLAAGYSYVSLTVGGADSNTGRAVADLALERRAWKADPRCLLVQTGADIERAKREGKLGIGFHFQDSLPIEQNLDLVELYHDLGVRHMLMAYNRRNFVADGCHEAANGGLSGFGRRVVREMNRVGMWVDVAHTGVRATLDTIEASTAPVICSHGNVAALHRHPRCYTDEQIRAIAGTGGVFGLTGLGLFMGGAASPERLAAQIDHVVQLVGPLHVGLGLDYVFHFEALAARAAQPSDALPADGGYADAFRLGQLEPQQMARIVECLLQRGYADADIAAVLGGNWLRLAHQMWR